jgi:hypothetical protein
VCSINVAVSSGDDFGWALGLGEGYVFLGAPRRSTTIGTDIVETGVVFYTRVRLYSFS